MTGAGHTVNPLAAITAADLRVLAQVEHHFLAWPPGTGQGFADLAGRALLSAVLFGGLNDPACWSGWLLSATKTGMLRSHESFWFRFAGGTGPNVYRTWFPDPISGCHLQALRDWSQRNRFDTSQAALAPALLQLALDTIAVQSPSVSELQMAASHGPLWLNEVCAARLHLRVPGLLADHATGKTRTHARKAAAEAPENPLSALSEFLASAEPLSAWQPWLTDRGLGYLRDVFFPDDPEMFASSRKLRAKMLAGLDEQLKIWSHRKWQNSIHRHMLLWLRQRLDTSEPVKLPHQGHIRPSTARRYLSELASYNWQGNRLRSIANKGGVDALAEGFAEMENAASARPPKRQRVVAAVLTSFSTYLHAQNPAIPIHSFKVEGSDGQKVRLPRLTVLDKPAFISLLQLLDEWASLPPRKGEVGRTERVRACKLAAILMFRAGLRGREVVNLALNDIAFEGTMSELVVRGNASRSNKNQFARRTLPLHVLLEPDELALLRRWHADRSNEEFRQVPRARLFPAESAAPFSVDQYLLEPIDAAIRLLFEGSFDGLSVRARPGYWYALASPLRHSFANHLIASLVLPDEPLNLPPPGGLTPDLVSVERKHRVSAALLRSQQHGLAVMQAVRYLMGHATYKRALETYIHNVDWLLAVHLWREVHQPPVTGLEADGLFHLLQPGPQAGGGRSTRQQRRQRNQAARQHSAPSALPRPRRGRPPRSSGHQVRRLSKTFDSFLHKRLPASVFGRRDLAGSWRSAKTVPIDGPSEGTWLALYNFLCLWARNVGPDEAAEQLGVSEAICRHWARRAGELAAVGKRPVSHGGGPDNGSCRFPQLASWGSVHPRGAVAKLIGVIWSRRAHMQKPRRWSSVQRVLSRWQLDPQRVKSVPSLHKRATFYRELGIPDEQLFFRVAGADWQPYLPSAFTPPPAGAVMQLTPAKPRRDGSAGQLLHSGVLQALLMVLIDSDLDFERLKAASPARKGRRPPANKRPIRLAKVEVRVEDVPTPSDTASSAWDSSFSPTGSGANDAGSSSGI